jgi:hypothetical protein
VMPVRERERMMKLQDVILKAMAKKLSWIAAAEIAGMSVRNMERKRQAYMEHGYTGLFDQRPGSGAFTGFRWRRGAGGGFVSGQVQ